MLVDFLIFAKWWKFSIIISLIFILKFQKIWIRFIMISKIKLKNFQINLMLELFMWLVLEWFKLLLNFYILGVSFFLWNFLSQIFGNFYVVYFFSSIWTIFSNFSSTRIVKLGIFTTKKTMLVLGWGAWGCISTIQTQNFTN